MLQTSIKTQRDRHPENAELRHELERVRAENAQLRRENRDLRVALDAYIARASSSRLYGPCELTAGTSVGPPR